MALKSRAISVFLLLTVFLATSGYALAGRAGPIKNKEEEKKQPEWFIGRDGRVSIPRVGRFRVPGAIRGTLSHLPHWLHYHNNRGYGSLPNPGYGRNWGRGRGRGSAYRGIGRMPGGRRGSMTHGPHLPYYQHVGYGRNGGPGTAYGYIPGGDDTFVPNPGFEIPVPSAP